MTRIERFTPIQRLLHFLLILTFVTQSVTGVARMYITTDWGQALASLFGGYHSAIYIHKLVGLLMLILFCANTIYLLTRVDWRRFPRCLYGPDSLLPRLEDAGQTVQHTGWLIGRAG